MIALSVGCSASHNTDAGVDAGLNSGIDSGVDDGGDGGSGECAQDGYACDADTPCCDALDQVCDPIQNLCVFAVDGGDGGPTLPDDGAQWVDESVTAATAGLDGLTAPSPSLQLAVGAGLGAGQILIRSADGGWSVLPGVPPAIGLYGIWADPAGDVYAVGELDGGGPLWLAGNVHGGLAPLSLPAQLYADAGPVLSSLNSVIGLSPGEAIAVGTVSFLSLSPPVALHLYPDGGVAIEPLPADDTRAYGLTGSGDGGPIYALGSSTASSNVEVLERIGGSWTGELAFGAGNLYGIAIGPAGDVTVVGDDGNGNGRVFTFLDGGFDHFVDGGYFPLSSLPETPPLTAVCEPSEGEFFFAASASNQALQMLHVDGGLANGVWWSETLPAGAQSVSAIAGDGAGNFYAVGVQSCTNCAGGPLAMRRVP
jgi:hypothetical protein